MVEVIHAEEEGWRPQGRCFNPPRWIWVWPFCSTAKGPPDHQWPVHAASTGVQQQLQPRQQWHLRWLPPGFGLQWADVSQEHEGVTLRSIQGEAEGALEPSHTREGYRECGIRERGHTVTVRRSALKDCFLKMLEQKKKDLSTWRCFIPFRHTKRCAVCWWWWIWQGAFDYEPSTAGIMSCGTWNIGYLDIFVDGLQRATMINDLKMYYIGPSWWLLNHLLTVSNNQDQRKI